MAVKDLRLDNCSVFITGSNSNLLSSEFLTLLSGRFVSFRIRPFIYKEIKEYALELNTTVSIADYFILCNNSRIFSIRSIHRYMKNDFPDLALSTVVRFIEYLKEAYIIDEVSQYSTKTKRELKYYGKIYNCDVSFNSLSVDNNRYEVEQNLENIIYNELLYMGYDLQVFINKGKEIDFIAIKNNKLFYVQVAYSVAEAKTYERIISAFDNLDNRNQKVLITNDIVDFSTSVVRHIKLEDFLMMDEL